jgi:hypothetical protein
MEIMSIERSTYEGNRLAATLVEELLTGFNSFVAKMKEMAVKQTKTKMSRTKARLSSSNSCVTF